MLVFEDMCAFHPAAKKGRVIVMCSTSNTAARSPTNFPPIVPFIPSMILAFMMGSFTVNNIFSFAELAAVASSRAAASKSLRICARIRVHICFAVLVCACVTRSLA